ncbi:hypothetical protein SALBM217S_03195 [Streptomyces griseoloalbus]
MAVLSATDILTAYLPVVSEHRGIAPATVGLLLSLRAAATIACRLVITPLLRLLGRTALLTVTCLLARPALRGDGAAAPRARYSRSSSPPSGYTSAPASRCP